MSTTGAAPGTSTQKVFICYRRDETAGHAGRLYDAIVQHYGDGNVFMDVELAPGVDFEERITEILSGCVAVIVVIGPSWATVEGASGGRRLDDPDDLVRMEVEAGLANAQKVYPVLVGGAEMPRREILPEPLRPLARRNAQELSNGRWAYDVGRLVSTLDELMLVAEPEPAVAPLPPPTPSPSRPALPGSQLVIEGTLVAALAAAAGRFLAEKVTLMDNAEDGESARETVVHIISETVRRTETAALAGLALAVWLALRIWRTDAIRPGLRGLLLGGLAGAVGGILWGVPVYAPAEKLEFEPRTLIDIGATAVSGGLFGAMIGSLWRPSRRGPAFLAGAIAGAVVMAFVLQIEWRTKDPGQRVWLTGLVTAAITGLSLATMVALDRGAERADVQEGVG